MVVEGKELKSLGEDRGVMGCWWVGLWGVPGQFSTSGIYEALRYAVMQKGILKLTKRPLVQALLFSRTSSSVLGTILRRATDCIAFYEAFFVRFKTWQSVPLFFFFFKVCLCLSQKSLRLLNCFLCSVSKKKKALKNRFSVEQLA